MSAVPRHVGLQAETGPIAPNAVPARHGACVGAVGAAGGLDPHERVSAAHARLAELHSEIAGIHQELARVQLDESAETRLMVPVPEVTGTRPLLSVRDVAELVRVDPGTVRNWREQGRLPAAVKIGGVIRWDADDIDRWIAEKQEVAQ